MSRPRKPLRIRRPRRDVEGSTRTAASASRTIPVATLSEQVKRILSSVHGGFNFAAQAEGGD